jgi:hypothetical protein
MESRTISVGETLRFPGPRSGSRHGDRKERSDERLVLVIVSCNSKIVGNWIQIRILFLEKLHSTVSGMRDFSLLFSVRLCESEPKLGFLGLVSEEVVWPRGATLSMAITKNWVVLVVDVE